MENKHWSITVHEWITVVFELIAFFIMFRHQTAASSHDFFVEQFLFVIPYVIEFAFTKYRVREIHYHLNLIYKLDYLINLVLSIILVVGIGFGLLGLITINSQMLKFVTYTEPLKWVCLVEFVMILNIIIFNYKVKKA